MSDFLMPSDSDRASCPETVQSYLDYLEKQVDDQAAAITAYRGFKKSILKELDRANKFHEQCAEQANQLELQLRATDGFICMVVNDGEKIPLRSSDPAGMANTLAELVGRQVIIRSVTLRTDRKAVEAFHAPAWRRAVTDGVTLLGLDEWIKEVQK